MKHGLYPVVVMVLFAAFVLLCSKLAEAAPRSRENAQEDALADDEIDPEDIVARGSRSLPASAGRPVLGAPSGSAWLSIEGFTRRTLDDRREVGGFVVLGLPLDRFTRSSTRVTSTAGEAPPGLVPGASSELPGLDNVSVSTVAVASASESPFELALTPRLARSCVASAWRAAGIGVDDDRLDAIVSRARWSSVLPEARLRAVRFDDARLSLDTSTDTNRLRDSAGANVGFEARLTWRFDRLLYADDEPSFERIRLELRDARTRIGAKVLDALFHWQRAALDLRALPPSQQGTRDEADVRLRLLEAEAALDVLTNGQFGSQLAAARGARSIRASVPEYAAPAPLGTKGGGDL